jgi:hypothetical protein
MMILSLRSQEQFESKMRQDSRASVIPNSGGCGMTWPYARQMIHPAGDAVEALRGAKWLTSRL